MSEKTFEKNPSYTAIELDRVRTLRYSIKSLYLLEEKTGTALGELFQPERVSTFTIKTIALLLWAGLIHEEPDLTVENAVDLLDKSPLTLTEIIAKISDAINNQVLAKVGGAPFGKQKKQKKPTG